MTLFDAMVVEVVRAGQADRRREAEQAALARQARATNPRRAPVSLWSRLRPAATAWAGEGGAPARRVGPRPTV